MKSEKPGPDVVWLIPATEDAVRVGVQPGTDDGIAVTFHVDTASLGRFAVPLNAHQVGAIAAMCNWLLKLDAEQVARLRDQLLNTEGEES